MKFSVPKGPKISAPKPGKIHPAVPQTKVRLPDAGSIGADPAPVVPNTGKI